MVALISLLCATLVRTQHSHVVSNYANLLEQKKVSLQEKRARSPNDVSCTPTRGTQRLFSVKYQFGEANIA